MQKLNMKKWLAGGLALCLLSSSILGTPIFTKSHEKSKVLAADIASAKTYQVADIINNLKLLGRTSTKESNLVQKGIELDWSATGVAFNMKATKTTDVVLKFISNGEIYFTVYLDGKQLTDKRYIIDSKKTITITGVTAGTHEIMIRRQTEKKHGTCSLMSITMDAELEQKPADKGLKIEVIGDSVTAGYGNLGSKSTDARDIVAGSPLYQDAMQTFGALLAKELDADLSIMGISGIGIACSNGNRVDKTKHTKIENIMPPYYEYVNLDKSDTKWDFGTGSDIVIINLGANDWMRHFAVVNGKQVWDDYPCGVTYNDVEKEMYKFIKTVRKNNPNAQIIWTYGLTHYACRDLVQVAVNKVNSEGDNKVSFLELKTKYGGFGGANGHPSAEEHQEAFQILLANLTTLDARITNTDSKNGVVKIATATKNDFIVSKFNKDVTTNSPVKVSVKLPNNGINEWVKTKGIKEVELTVTIPNNVLAGNNLELSDIILNEEVLETAKSKSVNLTVLLNNSEGKLIYSWTFNGKNIKNANLPISNVNLVLGVLNSKEDAAINKITSKDTKNNEAYVLRFKNDNFLPGQTKIKVFLGDPGKTKLTGKVHVYRLNTETKKYEEIPFGSTYSVDKSGYLTLDFLYYADYVIVKNKPLSKVLTSLTAQITALDKVSMKVGNTRQISVKLPEGIQKVDNLKKAATSDKTAKAVITYSTKDTKIITLAKTGIFTAKKAGKATITTTITLSTGEKKTIKTAVTVTK